MACRRSRRALVAGLVLTAAMATLVPQGASARAASEKIWVSVADAKGQPVTGLTAADFSIKIDSATQEVLSAVPATEPASVIILTDRLGLGGTYTVVDIGQALGTYIKTVRSANADSKFSLLTFDGTVLQITKFTSAAAELDRAVGRLATNQEDAALLDAMIEACRLLRSAPTERRAILTVLAAYRADQSTVPNDAVVRALQMSRASAWTIEVRTTQGTNYANPAREQVLDAGAQLGGGLRDTVTSVSGLMTATRRAADLLVSQYEITYGPGGGTARSRLIVGVNRQGVRVLAPQWLAK